MKLDQIIRMITNMFIRRAANTAMRKGIDMATRRGSAGTPPTTPAGKRQADQARTVAKNARKAARITRRLGR